MEIDRHFKIGFELRDDRSGARGSDEAGHILEGDDFGTESFHSLRFLDEIFVGENLLRLGNLVFLAEETGEEALLGLFDCDRLGVDSVADSAVGDAANGY